MGDARSQGFVQVSIPDDYERFMLRQLFEPWAVELLRRADLQPGWSVLDVASGWRDVRVETVDLDATWDSAELAADTVTGTPFGPLVSALPAQVQDHVRSRLITKLGGSRDGVTVRTAGNIARGVK